MQLIYYLLVGALKFNLTLRLDLSSIPLGLPKTAKRVIGTIGNTLGRITDCPLRFNEKVVENVYLSWADVAMIIVKSYIGQGITQIYSKCFDKRKRSRNTDNNEYSCIYR